MWTTPRHESPRAMQPSGGEPLPWRAIVVYLAVYLALDWASYIRPFQGLNITLWNPQPALAVALLMVSRRLWWVVTTGLLAAEFLVRGLPAEFVVVSLAAGALALSYLAIALALQRQLVGGRLGSARDVLWFLAVVACGSMLSAAVYVGTYATGSVLPSGPVWPALARYWVGDAVGMTVTLPLLLVAMDPARRDELFSVLRHRQWWVTAAFTVFLLWWFAQSGVQFSYAYLLLLPVIGASMRFGSPGAVLSAALTQVGLIVALQAGPHQDMLVVELQLLMAAITMTGLLLGITVDERARADAELRGTLRLAAAGHMSAALAHELSQPLTALSTYAQTCEMLARQGDVLSAERRSLLLDALRRITVDARRAGEVVKRLRDFFQSGATQLRPCDLTSLVQTELSLQQHRSAASGTRVDLQAEDDLPKVWLDEVQIQVVVRNLIANALDAADASGRPGLVKVRVGQGLGELLVEVTDTGPGVSAAQAQTVFDFGSSTKVGGMGVGLGISRALVEAHGGRLWAVPGSSGHFCFTLPTDRFDGDTETEATATPD